MANIDNTVLWSDNPEKFDEITKGVEFIECRLEDREPGSVYLRSRGKVPHEEIEAFSAVHPDMAFYAEHSFECTLWDTIWTVEYKKGASKVTKATANYMETVVPEKIKEQVPCYDDLYRKLYKIFARLDPEHEDPHQGIDWCESEVTVNVEQDGYRLQATKAGQMVDDIKAFKKKVVEREVWDEVTGEDDDGILF